MTMLISAGRIALDLILPASCMTCDTIVGAPGQFCSDCFRRTGFVTDPCCRRCGQPFAHVAQGGREMACVACVERPPPWREARAALCYDDQARRILLPFKYADRVEIAAGLARHMARAGASLLQTTDWLVPVPLHRRRLFGRRYNQSALLALALARLSGRPAVLDALRRVRATPTLQGLGPRSRTAAVAGAFAVRPRRRSVVEGARVLLIDDVLTTGATAGACARVLLAAGALQVDVLVAARVPDQLLD